MTASTLLERLAAKKGERKDEPSDLVVLPLQKKEHAHDSGPCGCGSGGSCGCS